MGARRMVPRCQTCSVMKHCVIREGSDNLTVTFLMLLTLIIHSDTIRGKRGKDG
jgi:hypothetical protein